MSCSALTLSVRLSRNQLVPAGLVRHQKRLNPVVVALLIDPIGDGHRLVGNLEPLAEGPSEVLQLGPGESPQAGVELLDRLGIEGLLAGISRG